MAGYSRVRGIGEISIPLEVMRVNGETKLVVSPWAALGTDTLLIGTGMALIFASDSIILRILGIAGTVWGVAALSAEIFKLL